ncbi:DUF695 domain-containing protein [Arthrobacter crusticola]|uniref:DUF695 domain-containing protein n=1 Tax=Arthrobacter crusticola TaxID=2547960 RepID=A0A4R5TT47_9MICC|nr:DUF695 domain-containing protein [Arthrobacter crusticola]TDK24072.1 DUF695 domain-containing protein [Arthrobacter crusticola]
MKFFQRFAPARSGDPVNDFWAWWQARGENDFTKAVGTGNFGPLMEPMTQRVKAIHPDLVWEARQGSTAQHLLCVTAGGIPAAREHSERWYRASPERGRVWEFSPVIPTPDAADLTFGGVGGEEIALGQLRFSVGVRDAKLDVTVRHAIFAQVDTDSAMQLAFMALDSLLGEDSVMRWIGVVETAAEAVPDSVEPSQLQSIAGAFARRTFESWQVLQQEVPDHSPRILRIRAAQWLDRPALELHCTLALPYQSGDARGLPAPDELPRLDAIEESLEDTSEQNRVLVAIESGQGRRVLHYYANPADNTSLAALERYAEAHPDADLRTASDPFWENLRTLRRADPLK